MKLIIYDFDGTIFKSPNRQQGENIYLEQTQQNLPFTGWWGRLESLMPPIIPLLPDQNWFVTKTVEHYHKHSTDKNNKLVLMTGRPIYIKNRVLEICDCQNLEFEEHYFRGHKNDKGNNTLEVKQNQILDLIKFDVNSIEIHEDRTHHVSEFCNFAKKCLQKHQHLDKFSVISVDEYKIYEFDKQN